MSEQLPSDTNHSAAWQAFSATFTETRWGLLELLRSRTIDPGRSLTMEMHDDIAWEQDGTPAELKQRLHVSALRNLTNASDDLWRTLRVWMDAGRPGDPYRPDPHPHHQQQRRKRFCGVASPCFRPRCRSRACSTRKHRARLQSKETKAAVRSSLS